ncbi:hypothetical protein QBC43DRAFT_336455 [Cladorrhinum sp. PSN259]|nr:hypothetical protein QBC43DRAFT_336455 [Cladorrhinum sp. PSN259]
MAIPKKKGESSKSSRPKDRQVGADSEVLLPTIETTDLSPPPNWEFWEIQGFKFRYSEIKKLKTKLTEVWSALSRAQYTTIPSEDSNNYKESKEQIRLRVSNNLAVVIQARLHFRKIYGTPSFIVEVSKAAALKVDQQIIQLITSVFTAARIAHIEHRQMLSFAPLFSTLTDMVDQWVRFTEGFSSLSVPKHYCTLTKNACHTWKDMVDRGAMMNLAQRPRREGTAPTIPVVINDDSDMEKEPSLPTKRKRTSTMAAPPPKRRRQPSADETDDSPETPATSSSWAPTSTDSGIGILPSSPPIFRRLRGRTLSPPPFTPSSQVDGVSNQLESLEETVYSHQTTLEDHEKRLKKLETPTRKKIAAATDITIKLSAQVTALEEKIYSKELYVKRVATEQFTLCKAGFDPLLKTANDRVNTLGEDLAIHKSSFASDMNALTSRVGKLEAAIPSLGAVSGSRSVSRARGNGVQSYADDASETRESDNDPSVISQLKDLDKRAKYLEKQPSTKELGNRLSAVESEIQILKERDEQREEEMSKLRRDLEEMRSRGMGMGHGDVTRLPVRPAPPPGMGKNNNWSGGRNRNGRGNVNGYYNK